MTESSIPPDAVTQTSPEAAIPIHPTDVLLALIVNFLVPMFMGASSGDLGLARMAAMETLHAYRARTSADVVTIAQIIGFGLGALSSLSLSMIDTMSLPMMLRLRANANGLHRSGEQNRQSLERSRAVAPRAAVAPQRHVEPAVQHPPLREADVILGVQQAQAAAAAAKARVAESAARQHGHAAPTVAGSAQPVGAPPPGRTASPGAGAARFGASPFADAAAGLVQNAAPGGAGNAASAGKAPPTGDAAALMELHRQALWATACAEVAAEYTAALATCAPHERQANSLRAAALSSSAMALAAGAEEGFDLRPVAKTPKPT